MVSVGPSGKVRLLLWPQNQPFLFFLLVHCLPLLGRAILVSKLPCLMLPPSVLLPSLRRRFAIMLPASFASKPDSSLASGMEGLRHNLAAIRANPPTPAAVSSLRCAFALEQGMGEVLSSTLSGHESGE